MNIQPAALSIALACCLRVCTALKRLTALALVSTSLACAQSYPTKPIRFIVPFPPGGGNDLLARELAQYLVEPLGQPVVVDNRPGASTIIGTELAAKAPPDGHTIFMGNNSTLAINPNLYKKLPYDAVKDFAPISLLASAPFVLLVHPSVPARSVKELIALAVTSTERSAALPDLPTVAEGGLKGYEAGAWYAVLVPTRTQPQIVGRLHSEFVKVLQQPKVQERLSSDGARIIGSTPEVLAKTIEADIARWGKVIKQTGLVFDTPR